MTQPNTPVTFNERKATEVAFYFLLKARNAGRNITKLRFMKWLYLAERLSYERFGEPLIGDAPFSMEHGPILSESLYLLENPDKAKHAQGRWHDVVNVYRKSKKHHQYVELRDDCGYESFDDIRALSASERELLSDVWEKYGHMSAKDLETLLHNRKLFPEWVWEEGDGSNPIELESLLSAVGYNDVQTMSIINRLREDEHLSKVFSH